VRVLRPQGPKTLLKERLLGPARLEPSQQMGQSTTTNHQSQRQNQSTPNNTLRIELFRPSLIFHKFMTGKKLKLELSLEHKLLLEGSFKYSENWRVRQRAKKPCFF
jgi:hypothetical protein